MFHSLLVRTGAGQIVENHHAAGTLPEQPDERALLRKVLVKPDGRHRYASF